MKSSKISSGGLFLKFWRVGVLLSTLITPLLLGRNLQIEVSILNKVKKAPLINIYLIFKKVPSPQILFIDLKLRVICEQN